MAVLATPLREDERFSFDDFIEYYDYEECEEEQNADDEYEYKMEEDQQISGSEELT